MKGIDVPLGWLSQISLRERAHDDIGSNEKDEIRGHVLEVLNYPRFVSQGKQQSVRSRQLIEVLLLLIRSFME